MMLAADVTLRIMRALRDKDFILGENKILFEDLFFAHLY